MINDLTPEEQETFDNIINLMKEEGSGSRGVFYENFGSSIRNTLVPLAEILEESPDKQKALEVATSLYRGY